jgi:hypothetical protein
MKIDAALPVLFAVSDSPRFDEIFYPPVLLFDMLSFEDVMFTRFLSAGVGWSGPWGGPWGGGWRAIPAGIADWLGLFVGMDIPVVAVPRENDSFTSQISNDFPPTQPVGTSYDSRLFEADWEPGIMLSGIMLCGESSSGEIIHADLPETKSPSAAHELMVRAVEAEPAGVSLASVIEEMISDTDEYKAGWAGPWGGKWSSNIRRVSAITIIEE